MSTHHGHTEKPAVGRHAHQRAAGVIRRGARAGMILYSGKLCWPFCASYLLTTLGADCPCALYRGSWSCEQHSWGEGM